MNGARAAAIALRILLAGRALPPRVKVGHSEQDQWKDLKPPRDADWLDLSAGRSRKTNAPHGER